MSNYLNRDIIKDVPITFTVQDFMDRFSDNPRCYLTGRPLDIQKTSIYHFDHIIPRSKGGSNEMDNLGLATKEANLAKRDMTLEEFLQMCVDVLKNFDIIEEK